MANKYLVMLYFILSFILTGCVTEEPIATPTVKHSTTSQIKDYVCTGEYDLKHSIFAPFTVDPEGNFYITHSINDKRMNIKKYNSQGKFINTWVPEIIKRKKDCWFLEKKHGPDSQELSDIFADNKNFYLAYGGSYGFNPKEGNFPVDYTGHIEQFDLNGNFITAIKPEKDSFHRDFVRYITKDKNGNFYLASWYHIEKYDSNWKLQSILYPCEQKKGSENLEGGMIGDLAVDSKGYIYTLIMWNMDANGYFAKFDSSGKLIKEWLPDDEKQLYFCAIEMDTDDNLYVLSIDKREIYHIQKFDSGGNFITEWISESTVSKYETSYTDMKVDSVGNVYVVSGKGSIKKFSPKQ